MSLEAELRSIILDDAAVAAIVGQRMYRYPAPDDAAYPCLVYRHVATDSERTLGGLVLNEQHTYSLWSVAASYGAALGLANTVLAVEPTGGATIDTLRLQRGVDDYDYTTDLFVIQLDVDIFVK